MTSPQEVLVGETVDIIDGDRPVRVLPVNIRSMVTGLTVRASTTEIPNLSITLVDPGFGQLAKGRWDEGTPVTWESWSMEIFEWEIPGGQIETVDINCADPVGLALKADEGGRTWRRAAPHEVIADVAAEQGGTVYGPSTTATVSAISRRGDDNPESSWDMNTRLARDADWLHFVVDGTVVFAPADWLSDNPLGDYVWEISWTDRRRRRPIEVPICRKGTVGDDAATVTVRLPWDHAEFMRPGHAATFAGISRFEGRYLITSVNLSAGPEEPVDVVLTQPRPPKPKAGSK